MIANDDRRIQEAKSQDTNMRGYHAKIVPGGD